MPRVGGRADGEGEVRCVPLRGVQGCDCSESLGMWLQPVVHGGGGSEEAGECTSNFICVFVCVDD